MEHATNQWRNLLKFQHPKSLRPQVNSNDRIVGILIIAYFFSGFIHLENGLPNYSLLCPTRPEVETTFHIEVVDVDFMHSINATAGRHSNVTQAPRAR